SDMRIAHRLGVLPGRGFTREPGTDEHGPQRIRRWPVFITSALGPRAVPERRAFFKSKAFFCFHSRGRRGRDQSGLKQFHNDSAERRRGVLTPRPRTSVAISLTR